MSKINFLLMENVDGIAEVDKNVGDRVIIDVNPIQNGLFRGCSWLGHPCHTYSYPTKLGIVIPYLNKIQKIQKSRDTPLNFCWHQKFITGNQQLLLYQKIRIKIAF